jgi:uncharacterized protein (DUF983 family)
MDAECPRCGEKGSFNTATRVFACSSWGTSLGFEDCVEEFASINDEKVLDHVGKGNPTP